jgi:hypothetical protein
MPPTVIVTNLSPGQLFVRALDTARTASAEITRLRSAPLAPGETLEDRTRSVAVHAHALAEAFDIIDALAGVLEHEPCGECDECTRENVSPEPSTVHRGVPPGEVN